MKEASEMSDSMTGKQLALARRQALSQGGKSALQPQAVKSNDVRGFVRIGTSDPVCQRAETADVADWESGFTND